MYYIFFQSILFFLNIIKSNKVCGFVLFVVSLLYFSFSYPGSSDFVGYYSHYDCLINDVCNDKISFELGYEVFVWVFGYFGYQFLIFSIGLFNIYCVFYFSQMFKKRAFFILALMGVMAWPLYTEALRQAIAISFLLLGIGFLSKGQTGKYILFVLLASLFHVSAIISLFAIIHIVNRKLLKILFLISLVVLVIFLLNPFLLIYGIIELIPVNSIAYEKLTFYIASDVYKPMLSLGLGVVPDLFLLFYIAVNFKRANIEQDKYWIYGGVLIFLFFVVFIGRVMPVLTRIGWYGLPFLSIFMYSSIWKSKLIPNFDLKYRQINMLVVYLWIFFQIIRPFAYDHSNFNIFKQESIFQNLNGLDDTSLRDAAENKCIDLISLGYDNLCYLK